MKNLKAWFSIASSTGLSVVSLGTPGLKEDLDEQVFAGGISAVSHLLSTEIGSAEKSFIGGGDTRKMGRFILDPKNNNKEVVSQFLLMSVNETKITDNVLAFIQEIAITFATKIVLSPLWDEVESSFKTLSSLDVYDIFIESIMVARKKAKVQFIDDYLDEKFNSLIDYTTKEPEFFDTLNDIKQLEPTLEDIKKNIVPNQKKIFNDLFSEIISIILDDDPIPVIFRNKPKDIMSDLEKMFFNTFDKTKTELMKDQLLNVTAEIFSGDIAELLNNFPVLEMHEVKSRIQTALANEVIIRIGKKNPILLLLNPELKSSLGSFNKFIEDKVEEIYQEYDLASILGKITSILLADENPISQYLISEFVRLFAMRFPGGLSEHAWNYIQTLFQLFSKTKQVSIKDALAKLEISDSHLETINSYLKGIKPNAPLKSLKFTIENEGDEIIKLYTTLTQVIIEGSQIFFDEIVWTTKQLGIFSQIYAEKIEHVVSQTQYLSSYLSMLKYMYGQQWEYIITSNYVPSKEDFLNILSSDESSKIDPKNITDQQLRSFWKPKYVAKCFENHSLKKGLKEIEKFSTFSDTVKQSIGEELEKLRSYNEKYLNGQKLPKTTIKGIDFSKIDDNFDDISILESNYKEITKNYSELVDRIDHAVKDIQELEKSSKKPKDNEKQLSKMIDELQKQEERFIKRIDDSLKKTTEYSKKTIKNIEKEIQRAQRGLQNKLQESIIHEYAISTHKNKEDFIIPESKKVCANITEEIDNSTKNDPFKVPKYNELVAVLASIIIFNQLPKNVFNDLVNQTILSGGRSSPLISDLLAEIRKDETFHVEDYLRKNVRHEVEKKIKFLFESILNRINTSYMKGVVKLYPINSREFGEISCVDLGELNVPWIIEDFKKIIPESLGTNLHFVKVDDKYHLFYEIERFPSSGQRFPMTKAIIQGTWNEIIGDQTGLFIEILKMSCEMIGESRRRRFQEFLEKLFQIMD